jgi:gamma-glutamylcyclotransferase (GGCT)/AIG2-like uncharacterized protein YtfP
VFEEVDAQALALLDAYEGGAYARIVVEVEPAAGSACPAYVYVPADRPR